MSAVDSLTIDAAGDVYFVYATNTNFNENKKLYLKKSKDCINWGPAVLINDQGDSNYPQIVAGATAGDIRISWQDDRNGPQRFNTYFVRSANGANGFTAPVRLSNVGLYSGAPYKFDEGYLFPYGDYISHTIDKNGVSHIIWGEGLARSLPGSSWYSHGQ